jgi:hypothetical protein
VVDIAAHIAYIPLSPIRHWKVIIGT